MGLLGPETVYDRCRKKTRRVARWGTVPMVAGKGTGGGREDEEEESVDRDVSGRGLHGELGEAVRKAQRLQRCQGGPRRERKSIECAVQIRSWAS